MINEKSKFLTVSWLSGLLSAEIFISTGECPVANTDRLKQSISAVRASGGFPGNVLYHGYIVPEPCRLVNDINEIKTYNPTIIFFNIIILNHCIMYALQISSVNENHRTCRTFPMAKPKCLMRDFINLNRIYKADRTKVWWIMKVFWLYWISREY